MGNLTFNGVSTETLGVVIQTPPVYEFPTRKLSTIEIPGRNGDILIDKNSFSNSTREYNIAAPLDAAAGSFVAKARKIVDWLSSVGGYARLEDSYEPLYFRLAMYRSGGQMPNFYDKATAMNIKFECKPQRFLKTGDVSQSLTDNVWKNIVNDTNNIALPEITVSGTDVKIELSATENGVIISSVLISGIIVDAKLDSDLQDCYNNSEYLNSVTTIINGFPKLYPGNNWIRITSSNGGSIKSRTWVL